MHIYKKKLIWVLMVMLMMFAALAIKALLDLKEGTAMFKIGVGYVTEDILVIMLSILSMVKIIHEIIIIERH